MDIYQVIMLALLIFSVGMVVYTILRDSVGFNRLIGIDYCKMDEEQKEVLKANVNRLADEFTFNYTPMMKPRWVIKLRLIGLDGYDNGVQEAIDSIKFNDSVDKVVVYCDRLVCHMNEACLKESWELKRAYWIEVGMGDRVAYYEGRESA